MPNSPIARATALALTTVIASLSSVAHADSSWVIWSQPLNTNWAIVPSYASTKPTTDIEIADDVEIIGSVDRVVATGWNCINCVPPILTGVYVRFYEWTSTGPGGLDAEYFVPAGDPGLVVGPNGPGTIDVTLPSAYPAEGKRFVAVEPTFLGGGSWYWWVTNVNAPNGSGAMTRDRSAGPDAPWAPINDVFGPLASDVAIMLWGDDGNPPPPGTDPCGPWSTVTTPDPAGTDHAILRDVHAISPEDVWAVGEYTALVDGSFQTFSLAEHWDGAAWTIIPSPNPSACTGCTYVTFDAVDAVGPNDVWAAGGKRVQGPDGFMGTHIFVARYDGSDWTVMNTPLTAGGSGAHVQDIEVVSENDIWFFGDFITSTGWPALAMHWDGSAFTVFPTPFPSGGTPGWGLEAGSAIASDDIWAVGGGSDGDYTNKGYIIHWDGSSWTRFLGPTPGTDQRLWAIDAIATDDVWAVGDYFAAGSGYFPLFLHWDGSSWTQVESPGGGLGVVAFASDNVYSGGAGIVHWDGTQWEQVESFPTVDGASVSSISGSALCDLWAVGRRITAGNLLTFASHLHPIEVGEFSSILGDINSDGTVNASDLGLLLGGWGQAGSTDLDNDGTTGSADLAILLGAWNA